MQIPITFTDRSNNTAEFTAATGRRVREVLLDNYVPPEAVVVTRDGVVVPDSHCLTPDATYEVALIDGYDIEDIRRLYLAQEPGDGVYEKRYLDIEPDGSMSLDSTTLTYDQIETYVERTVRETVGEFDLVSSGDSVLATVTGGVDSAVTLMALRELQPEFGFELSGITFGEPGIDQSPSVAEARAVCDRCDVKHTLVPEGLVADVFGTTASLDRILSELTSTEDAEYAVVVESHVIRRTYEAYAARNGFDAISYGLHTTDVLAGLLHSYATGNQLDEYVKKEVGPITYIYPVTFLLKKEIHHYYRSVTGEEPRYTPATIWKKNPADRSFYAYVANVLQTYWPGVGRWLIQAHNERASRRDFERTPCRNCGGIVLGQSLGRTSDRCLVCRLLDEYGFVDR